MIVPLNRSQIFTLLRCCHHHAYFFQSDNWGYYTNVEKYLRDWNEGNNPEKMGRRYELEGKIPTLQAKQERICRIIRKVTKGQLKEDTKYLEIRFSKLEITTIIKLSYDYNFDMDVLCFMGSREIFVKGEWIWLNNSDNFDRTFEILPDKAFKELEATEIKSYFSKDASKAFELETYFKDFLP